VYAIERTDIPVLGQAIVGTGIPHQGNVGAWSKVVLNAPGPPRGVVVPVVHLVHSDPH